MRLIIPWTALLNCLLGGAHFLRAGETGLSVAMALMGLAGFSRKAWLRPALLCLLVFCAFVWADTFSNLIGFRLAAGLPWGLTACISGGVLVFNLAGIVLLLSAHGRKWFSKTLQEALPRAAAFVLTCGLLIAARAESSFHILLVDRFFPGWGGVEILALGVYAAWITGLMLDPVKTAAVRGRIWGLFSLVFFLQLGLGLAGVPQMLMTGNLHLPVPALIAAGPAYCGEGFFMLILFALSVLLVGPAWCSHLCYVGAWDHFASKAVKRTGSLPPWAKHMRTALLVLALTTALALRYSGLPVLVAVWSAAAFGLSGVAVMLAISRRSGIMTHCTAFCPMGVCANILGKLNPWRMAIGKGCTQCGKCSRACRYSALTTDDLERGRVGLSCSLCGDCVNACPDGRLHYTFPGLTREGARAAFIAVAVGLHAVFLGVARI